MGYSKPNFGRVGWDVKIKKNKKLWDPKPIIHKQAMVFFFILKKKYNTWLTSYALIKSTF